MACGVQQIFLETSNKVCYNAETENKWWPIRENARVKRMKLICIGDSLTFGYGVRPSQRWTRLCAQETGWEIVNEGISGDTTGGMLVRLRALLADRDICVQRPLVLLMGGANDIFFSGTDTGARANMGAMLNQLLSLGVHTMIGIPTPEGHQIMARRLCAHLKKDNDD